MLRSSLLKLGSDMSVCGAHKRAVNIMGSVFVESVYREAARGNPNMTINSTELLPWSLGLSNFHNIRRHYQEDQKPQEKDLSTPAREQVLQTVLEVVQTLILWTPCVAPSDPIFHSFEKS